MHCLGVSLDSVWTVSLWTELSGSCLWAADNWVVYKLFEKAFKGYIGQKREYKEI